jgi:hypothetical protein
MLSVAGWDIESVIDEWIWNTGGRAKPKNSEKKPSSVLQTSHGLS